MLRNLILRAKAALVQRLPRHWANRLGLKPHLPGDPSLLVHSLYKAAFGRLADPAGMANRVNQLQSGASLKVLAEGLVASAEFQTRHGSTQNVDTEFLNALYRDGLGRKPDPDGLANWLAEAENGATRAKVLAAFAVSEEAMNVIATMYANSLYMTAFGRPADEDGLANGIRQLQSGVTLQTLAEGLVASAQFKARHGVNQRVDTEFLAALYRDGLGRQPDLKSLAFWLAEGKRGTTRAEVLAALAGSGEALERVLPFKVNSRAAYNYWVAMNNPFGTADQVDPIRSAGGWGNASTCRTSECCSGQRWL